MISASKSPAMFQTVRVLARTAVHAKKIFFEAAESVHDGDRGCGCGSTRSLADQPLHWVDSVNKSCRFGMSIYSRMVGGEVRTACGVWEVCVPLDAEKGHIS